MRQQMRFEQLLFAAQPLDQEAAQLRAQAAELPHGPEREELLRRAHRAETAVHVDEWLSSPGLRGPQ